MRNLNIEDMVRKYDLDFLLKGEHPTEFNDILEKVINDGLYRDYTIAYVVDFHPFYLIHNRIVFGLSDDFVDYLRAIQEMRINLYCPFIMSWKEYYKNYLHMEWLDRKNVQ